MSEDPNSIEQIEIRKNQEDPIIMYLVVRESLGMGTGKACAQVGHACQMLMLKRDELLSQLDFIGVAHQQPLMQALFDKAVLFNKWLNTSFRKVVLKADDKNWEKIKNTFIDQNMVVVIDNGLTEIPSGSETVIGLWPMIKSQAPKLIKRLQTLK